MKSNLRQTLAHLVAPALLCLSLLPHTSQATTKGSGRAVSEVRSVAEFQAVVLRGSMDLNVRQGPTQSLQVEADDNLLPLLETVVEPSANGPRLLVRWKQRESLNTRSRVRVTVVVPRLTALAALGSGDIQLDTFNTPVLKVSLSGSGDARLTGLTTDDLGIAISGSGDVVGNGSAARVKVSIAGSGDVRLTDMKADDVTVSIAGSGDAAVYADKTLSVTIAGSGDVSYTGNAAVKSRVAGNGSVVKR